MITNLRASNGGGKTTIYHWLIDNHEHEPLYSPNFRTQQEHKPRVFRLTGDLYCVGRYAAGADGIGFAALQDLVRAFGRRGHVIFENVMVSANISSWLPIRREFPDVPWIWATLDTPQDVCLQRIYGRNGGKPIKEEPIKAHYRRVRRMHDQLTELGEQTVLIDHTKSIEQVHELLQANGWRCGH